ncbi:Pex11p NDAI_0G03700 [Naumovozyma dairenensis CBS 421]|uniref:Peroxisomal membrane protein PEX11 n=1 Tax=Naumovozyma dairenensis (strain ATCC 10597 / BCRC 20456 / CBS 421 / NBRC 0211 / NRRL Y-12639) TaxID=1071378 RepID=G0WED6_NAUDC|nr:hypothetical protein NDAI_0G03700 [Naumovozyma dairenensis CBS 421]CCD26147.2 hypothetical protein NDAI_0G03700 [Naumovozyma dairenensis CBS 421]
MPDATIVLHPTITHLVKFLDTTAGREKVLRLLQYLCRVIALNQKSPLAKGLQMEFTMIRKLLRFLKPLNHLQLASKFLVMTSGKDEDFIIKYCNVLKNLFFAIYLSLDQVNLFRLLKLIPVTPFTGQKVPRWANFFWLFALVSGIVMDLRKIQTTEIQLRNELFAKKSEQSTTQVAGKTVPSPSFDKTKLKIITKEKYAAVRRLVWDCADSFIVLNNLNYLKSRDDYVGMAGVVTSLFGLQDLWKAAVPSK